MTQPRCHGNRVVFFAGCVGWGVVGVVHLGCRVSFNNMQRGIEFNGCFWLP